MPPINSPHLILRLRERNAEVRRSLRLRGIRSYDETVLRAQLETLDDVLDLCNAALDHDDTRDLALAILIKLANAYRVTVHPKPGPLD
jgi:hypothetical protein